MDIYLGMIAAFAFEFEPNGWMKCDGRFLPIQNYQALFSLLGYTYGGEMNKTFALPDLRGRTAVGTGQAPGRAMVPLGRGDAPRQLDVAGTAPSPTTVHLEVPQPAVGLNYCICVTGAYPPRA